MSHHMKTALDLPLVSAGTDRTVCSFFGILLPFSALKSNLKREIEVQSFDSTPNVLLEHGYGVAESREPAGL